MAKIQGEGQKARLALEASEGAQCKRRRRCSTSVQAALEDVTALFYHEDRNEIYTGNRNGLVHVWSN